jgi:hypothetical protein
MQPSLEAHRPDTRHLRPIRVRKGRWMDDEYPAGYVAQLARPLPGAAARANPAARSEADAADAVRLMPAA